MHTIALDGGFWFAVLQIILIDILLGGDNAVVIALACRRLPERQRRQGIFWGVVGAVGLRIVLIFFALQLLAIPYLKAAGALLLLWIGIRLVQPEDDGGDGGHAVAASASLLGAVKTVIVADAVMSLDNVIAVAGAANGNMALVVFGIVVSVPLIVWGSKLVLHLMDRFPIVITLGGALLGWIAGGMLVGDPAFAGWAAPGGAALTYVASAAGALTVLIVGTLMTRRAGAAAGVPGEVEMARPAEQET